MIVRSQEGRGEFLVLAQRGRDPRLIVVVARNREEIAHILGHRRLEGLVEIALAARHGHPKIGRDGGPDHAGDVHHIRGQVAVHALVPGVQQVDAHQPAQATAVVGPERAGRQVDGTH